MIRKTVYFRTPEDLDKFNAIGNKTQWFHEHLNDNPKPDLPSMTVKVLGKEIKIIGNFCKNGHSIPENRSKCLAKGCKYS